MKIEISSHALRAAMTFKAKDDIREQLNGVTITNGTIFGSNGFTACLVPHPSLDCEDCFIFVSKVPPATAETSVIEDEQIIHYDAKGVEKAREAAKVIAERNQYDINRLIPTDKKITPYEICVAPDYLGLISKAFPRPKKAGLYSIKITHSEPGKPMVFEVKSKMLPAESATVLIMPVRE
jgi:hypothetical protein